MECSSTFNWQHSLMSTGIPPHISGVQSILLNVTAFVPFITNDEIRYRCLISGPPSSVSRPLNSYCWVANKFAWIIILHIQSRDSDKWRHVSWWLLCNHVEIPDNTCTGPSSPFTRLSWCARVIEPNLPLNCYMMITATWTGEGAVKQQRKEQRQLESKHKAKLYSRRNWKQIQFAEFLLPFCSVLLHFSYIRTWTLK